MRIYDSIAEGEEDGSCCIKMMIFLTRIRLMRCF